MADVFISYHEDSAGELVAEIAKALDEAGITCWYAERSMRPGSFGAEIVSAIRSCRVFLLVLNKESNQSLYVVTEAYFAFTRMNEDRKKNIQSMLPVIFKIDDCIPSDDLSFFTGLFTITDGISHDSQRINALVKQIHDCLSILFS